MILFVAFLLTIPAANWLIGNVGTTCIPNGPCLLPVGFGLMAPSGVLMIGLALVLRDAVQSELGKWAAILAIVIGAALSTLLASPALALASGAAFLLAESFDMLVYTPLRRRNLALAVMASGVVGAVADSIVFLYLAFGSLEFLMGQVVGKLWITLAVAAILMALRKETNGRSRQLG
jgi:queuosine precursor transporter